MSAPAEKTPAISRTALKGGLSHLHSNLFTPSRIVKTDIILPWMSRPKIAFTLDHVFTPDECDAMIAATESCGYGAALVNTGGGRQELINDFRNNTRCMIDDALVAQSLFERIQPFLPHELEAGDNYMGPQRARLTCLNERLRFLKYTSGQKFNAHYDGHYVRPKAKPGHSQPEKSFITVQLYLNSGDPEASVGTPASTVSQFTGGCTAFLNAHASSNSSAVSAVDCVPRVGRVLVFEHHILHQGSEVNSGVKYCLRTDAMYQPQIGSPRTTQVSAAAALAAPTPVARVSEAEAGDPYGEEDRSDMNLGVVGV